MAKLFRGLLVDKFEEANVHLFGVPFDGNVSISKGASLAPAKLREISSHLPPFSMAGKPMIGVKIYDAGDLECDHYEDLFPQAGKVIADPTFKLIFGGDHSITIPFQKAFIEKTLKNGLIPVIVHLDAHCDINAVYHGSAFSHGCTIHKALENGLKEEDLFLVGIREFEQDGFDLLLKNQSGAHLFTAMELLEKDIGRLKEELLLKNDGKHAFYVSFDIDALDASYAPGTGTPETCGLTPIIMRSILDLCGSLDNVDVLDLTEVAPPLDINDITSWAAVKLVYEFLAAKFI